MMMKEHIVDNYGEIKYTVGNGCSGGSIGQNTVASIYPGLLDGIQPSCDFPDSITTGIEVSDCVLLVNAYQSAGWQALMATEGMTQAQVNAKKTAINGHLDQTACHGWYKPVRLQQHPRQLRADGRGRQQHRHPRSHRPQRRTTASCRRRSSTTPRPTRPARAAATPISPPRCGARRRSPGGGTRALQTTDNVGVQYGLKALLAGQINSEEFVTLNEKIGGVDTDSKPTTTRAVADTGALDIAYKAGIVSNGKNLGKVAIIDSRGYDEIYGNLALGQYGIHQYWRSYSERDRLDADAGSHANQVIWRYGYALTPVGPAQTAAITTASFLTMDTWLSSLVTSAPKAWTNDVRTQAQVIAGKPAAAVDLCYLSTDVNFTTPITTTATCDADPRLIPRASPRQIAGGPRAENILKCTLKPVAFTDYTGITFTAGQQARLNAVFPTGVCDWSKAGVSQQDPVAPLTFTAGPGGSPLGARPVSTTS